jgi:hypothetical protein
VAVDNLEGVIEANNTAWDETLAPPILGTHIKKQSYHATYGCWDDCAVLARSYPHRAERLCAYLFLRPLGSVSDSNASGIHAREL